MNALDIRELRQAFADELEKRRCSGHEFSFSQQRDGPEALYGITGAINVLAALGLPLGDRAARARIAGYIASMCDSDGRFEGGSGPGHAIHMVTAAFNLLGEPVPGNIAPLAPTDVTKLPLWLDSLDWQTTHKEFCGQTIPLLASGRVDARWINCFVDNVSSRISLDRPRQTWCATDAPSWRVVSCIFHVLSAFDAGRLPYPQPELLIGRLLDLHWHQAPDDEIRTCCTDGDWAWLLLRLCEQLPQYAEQSMQVIRLVSARRVRTWHTDRQSVLDASTHDLYCYLWSTAVFQSCVREHYTGGYVRDTFNDPAMFRLDPQEFDHA